jgi:Fic family protein
MSPYFDANKDAYIDRLFKISTDGAWESWIEFCLQGVAIQARDSQQRCERLLRLHRDFNARLASIRGSVRLAAIVDDLFQSPVAQVPRTAARHDVTYPTARADLIRLEAAGILKRFAGEPQITYFCEPIMKIIYSD